MLSCSRCFVQNQKRHNGKKTASIDVLQNVQVISNSSIPSPEVPCIDSSSSGGAMRGNGLNRCQRDGWVSQ